LKTVLHFWTEMHLFMFKNEEYRCSSFPLCPRISMLLETAATKPSFKQKGPPRAENPIHALKLGARDVCQAVHMGIACPSASLNGHVPLVLIHRRKEEAHIDSPLLRAWPYAE